MDTDCQSSHRPLYLFLSSHLATIRRRFHFYITDSPQSPIVLGHTWLQKHNPRIDWRLGSVASWSEECHWSCLLSAGVNVSESVFQGEAVDLANVPAEYHDLKEVFSKSRADSLPPHRPYDCAIELLPGTSPPKGKLYSLSIPETAAMEKCVFHAQSVSFLGHIISTEGVRMDPEKVKAVVNWPSPESRKALQRFLGFANFYRRFIRNFSQLAAPLTALTSPSLTFRWSNAAEAAFAKLKSCFVSAPILVTPDRSRQFIVEVDASEVGGRSSVVPNAHPQTERCILARIILTVYLLQKLIMTLAIESCWQSNLHWKNGVTGLKGRVYLSLYGRTIRISNTLEPPKDLTPGRLGGHCFSVVSILHFLTGRVPKTSNPMLYPVFLSVPIVLLLPSPFYRGPSLSPRSDGRSNRRC
uniref:Reverse transcriptase/retrotransposon-derived protein RNase H-like domain-containing protein n=1 Tax=Cyprinus carpio carpio TaxID=630221 RepID=A0A9J8BWS8_CYPCA